MAQRGHAIDAKPQSGNGKGKRQGAQAGSTQHGDEDNRGTVLRLRLEDRQRAQTKHPSQLNAGDGQSCSFVLEL